MSNFTPAQRDWIDALRSGEYTQCQRAMIKKTGRGTSHCCLGVAGDRYIKNGGEGISIAPDGPDAPSAAFAHGFKVGDKLGIYAGSWLPPAVEEHLNLRGAYWELAKLNDTYNWSFEQIADELEAHPEKYFTNFNS